MQLRMLERQLMCHGDQRFQSFKGRGALIENTYPTIAGVLGIGKECISAEVLRECSIWTERLRKELVEALLLDIKVEAILASAREPTAFDSRRY